MAKLRGEYKPAMTRAMLTGSFVDSYFEGTLDLFINEHPAVFTQKQELRSEFKKANEIIARIIRTIHSCGLCREKSKGL